jgi:hypothetical protein
MDIVFFRHRLFYHRHVCWSLDQASHTSALVERASDVLLRPLALVGSSLPQVIESVTRCRRPGVIRRRPAQRRILGFSGFSDGVVREIVRRHTSRLTPVLALVRITRDLGSGTIDLNTHAAIIDSRSAVLLALEGQSSEFDSYACVGP